MIEKDEKHQSLLEHKRELEAQISFIELTLANIKKLHKLAHILAGIENQIKLLELS